MRYISGTFAVLAALLVKEAVAGPQHHGHLHKKAVVVDVVTDVDVVYDVVTDVVWVTVIDGSGAVTTTPAPAVAPVVLTTSSSVTFASAAVIPPLPSSVVAPVASIDSKGVAPPPPVESSSTAVAISSVAVAAPAAVELSSMVVAAHSAPVPASKPTTFATSVSTATTIPLSTTAVITTSESTVSTTSSTTTSGSKRGLAYNDASLLNLFTGSNSLITWCYNWGSSSGGSIPSNFEYVPMLWSNSEASTASWSTDAQAAIDEGSKYLLAFNEPNNSGQSNMDVADAVAGYIEYMNPFAGKAQLGAPAVDNSGLDYLREFIAGCSECHIDFVPIHWYDSATNYVYFKEYIQEAYVAGGNRTLWITEFGATGSTDEQTKFLEVVMPWLDEQHYVERYSYYMDKVGVLLDTEAELSTIGTAFLDYTSNTIDSLIADV